jgi:hypothetical protein
MKSKKAVILGLAAFLLAMVVVLPASWMARALPEGLACGEWRGSIWRGQCRELSVRVDQNVAMNLSSVSWQVRPMSLLRLRLSVDFQSTWTQGKASGRADLASGGAISLRETSGSSRLDRRLIRALPDGWSGQAEIRQLEFEWQQNTLRRLAGVLIVSDLRDARGNALGGYQLELPAGEAAPFTGQLRDTGGPLEVNAQLQLAADRSWSLEGRMRQRTADMGLARTLDMLSSVDASGWRRLSAAGDFT